MPSDWELARVQADGAVVYTNGAAVYRVGADGKRVKLFAHDMIEQVVVC